MPILAAMGKREAGGIREAAGRAMDNLRHHGERLDGACADARCQKQVLEVLRATIGGCGERPVQAAQVDVLFPHIVMIRHDEMRQEGLGDRKGRFAPQRCEFPHDPVRAKIGQKIQLSAT